MKRPEFKKRTGKEEIIIKDCTLKWSFLRLKFFRASGEAILGTQRYYFSQTSLDEGFQKNLAASEQCEEKGRNFEAQILENHKPKKKRKGIMYLHVPKNALLAIRTLTRNQF